MFVERNGSRRLRDPRPPQLPISLTIFTGCILPQSYFRKDLKWLTDVTAIQLEEPGKGK